MSHARRLVVGLGYLLALLLVVLVFRVSAIQIGLHETAQDRFAAQTLRMRQMKARRGSLLDRHHRPIASSRPTIQVETYWRNLFQYREAGRWKDRPRGGAEQSIAGIAAALAPIVDKDPRDLEMMMRHEAVAQLGDPIKHPLRIEDIEYLRLNQAGKRGALSRVDLRESWEREYPWHDIAGNLLGWVRNDGTPGGGLEWSLDDVLSGADGVRLTRWDGFRELDADQGHALPAVEPLRGADVVLTLDMPLQSKVEEIVKEALREQEAQAVVAVVLDVPTGDILAFVSAPGINPEEPQQRLGEGARIGAAQLLYAPGSTMKPLMMASALQLGLVEKNERVDCSEGLVRFGRRVVRDSDAERRPLTLREVLVHSSNVGMSSIMARLIPEGERGTADQFRPIFDILSKLGFGKATFLPLPGERAGHVTDIEDWTRNYTLVSVSFGYEMAVTAIQMAAAISSLSDGFYRLPRLVKAVGHSEPYQPVPTSEPIPVFRPEIAETVRQWMVDVVDHKANSFSRIGIPGVEIAGKTGTVDIPGPQGKPPRHVHSFVALAPANDPKIALAVVVFEPKHARYSNQSAAPAATAILKAALPYLGVELPDPEMRP